MKLTYKMREQDYLAHQLFVASRSELILKQRFRHRFYIPVFYFILAGITYFQGMQLFAGIIAGLSVLWILGYPAFSRWYYRRHYRNHIRQHYSYVFDKEGTLALEEDSIVLQNEGNESKIALNEVQELCITGDYGFAGLKSGHMITIPKDQISAEELNAFMNELSKRTGIEIEDLPDWQWR